MYKKNKKQKKSLKKQKYIVDKFEKRRLKDCKRTENDRLPKNKENFTKRLKIRRIQRKNKDLSRTWETTFKRKSKTITEWRRRKKVETSQTEQEKFWTNTIVVF